MTYLTVTKAQTIINIPNEGIQYIGTEILTAVDENNTIRIEDILSNESSINFQSNPKQSIGNSSAKSFWLKLRIANNTGQRAFIDFNPSLADSIALYSLNENQKLSVSYTGMKFKFSERGIQHFSHNLELPNPTPQPKTYYIRLVTRIPTNYFMRIGTEKTFWHSYSLHNNMWGLLSGIIVLIIIVGTYILFFIKYNRYFLFIPYLIFSLAVIAFYNGKLQETFFVNTPQYSIYAIIVKHLYQISGLIFAIYFLKIKKYFPTAYKVSLFVLTILSFNIILYFVDFQKSLYLVNYTELPTVLFCLYLAIRAYSKNIPVAKLYITGWSAQPIVLGLYTLANIGMLTPQYFTTYFTYIPISLQSILIAVAFTKLLLLLSNKEKEAQALFIKVLNEKQENINKHNRELEQVVTELKREFALSLQREKEKEEKLIKNNKELQEFASIVSHDLRAPLRNINSFAQILIRKNQNKFDEKDQEYAQFILQGVKQSTQLIEDLLNYSRMEKNIGPPENIDLNDAVIQVLNNNKNYISEKNTSISIHLLPEIQAHRSLIALIWQNLILNGIKYNDSESPHIEIGVKEDKDETVFFVKDNGIGIPLQYQEEIFRMFRRLHTTEKYEGTGIGLAFCKRVIEFYDGNIWFESEMEKGTCFYFTLPKVISNINGVHNIDHRKLALIDVAA